MLVVCTRTSSANDTITTVPTQLLKHSLCGPPLLICVGINLHLPSVDPGEILHHRMSQLRVDRLIPALVSGFINVSYQVSKPCTATYVNGPALVHILPQ
jgi:hypothetical protein